MNSLSPTAPARSRLFQLLALGFVHPVEEFHATVADHSYASTLVQAARKPFDIVAVLGQAHTQFTEYEAEYIRLFQVGKRGQPIVHLNASNYEKILGSGSRPEFLLEYSGWYRHFGLKTNEDDQANEFPDHIVCQLEFLAWLSHLEQQAAEKPEIQFGYQCAQRDFIERHLRPFLELLHAAINQQNQRELINPFFVNLSALALEAVTSLEKQFNHVLGASMGQKTDPDRIASVNLWG